jgi:hypothetical protein
VTAGGAVGERLSFTVLAAEPATTSIRDGSLTPDPITIPFAPGSAWRVTLTGTGLRTGSPRLVIASGDFYFYTAPSNLYPQYADIVEWTDTRIVFDLKLLPQLPGLYSVNVEQSTIPDFKGWNFVVAPPP